MNRFQFVADHRDAFEVKRLCEIVQVRRSSFYAWLAAAPARTARARADAALAERIRAIHSQRPCGVPEVGPGSLTSDDRWSDMILACRCGCCT